MTDLMTKEEVLEQPWATEYGYGAHDFIAVQYSPIVNWYAFKGFECPIDGTEWSWEYEKPIPQITTQSPRFESHEGFELLTYGHRVVAGKCEGECGENFYIQNFDHGV